MCLNEVSGRHKKKHLECGQLCSTGSLRSSVSSLASRDRSCVQSTINQTSARKERCIKLLFGYISIILPLGSHGI